MRGWYPGPRLLGGRSWTSAGASPGEVTRWQTMTVLAWTKPHVAPAETHRLTAVEQTTCCIVGAGPAGAVLALLLARTGVPVVLLEAFADFAREFRGDGLSPGSLEIMR